MPESPSLEFTAFIFMQRIYPVVALVCGVVALVIRWRVKGARPWICLVLPIVNIAAVFAFIATG